MSDLDPVWESVVLRAWSASPRGGSLRRGVVASLRGEAVVPSAIVARPAARAGGRARPSPRWRSPPWCSAGRQDGGCCDGLPAPAAGAPDASAMMRRVSGRLGLQEPIGPDRTPLGSRCAGRDADVGNGCGRSHPDGLRRDGGAAAGGAPNRRVRQPRERHAGACARPPGQRLTGARFVHGARRKWRQIRLDVRLQDTKDGEVVASSQPAGHRERPLRSRLADGRAPSGEAGHRRGHSAQHESRPGGAAPGPGGGAAVRGGPRDACASSTRSGARDLFEQAKGKEPAHALTRAALSHAWTLLGNDRRAEEEAKTGDGAADLASREDRLSIEGQYREAAPSRTRPSRYSVPVHVLPGQPGVRLRLASVQESGGRGMKRSRRWRPAQTAGAVGHDPRIDVAEAVTRATSDSRSGAWTPR